MAALEDLLIKVNENKEEQRLVEEKHIAEEKEKTAKEAAEERPTKKRVDEL